MFYPDIVRRTTYSTKIDGAYYANYSHYETEITEDCKQRCVYCDITLSEHGGEGMQLDHFKPQKHFERLKKDPNNLVLACPKCNRLKSDHWPVKEEIGLNGFLDPFTSERSKWYHVKPCGIIEHNDSNATALKIEILRLNRPARVQIRRKRLIEKRVSDIDERLNEKLIALRSKMTSGVLADLHSELLDEIIELKNNIDALRTL